MGRRVPAARVVLANGAGALALVAQERVDERRLADARRAEDDRGAAGGQVVVAERRRRRRRSARNVRTSTPGATASAATRSPSGSAATSALLSTMTGVAPPVHATAR